MPEKCRVGVCGFDPMIVRGYVKTGFRALWWYLPDELFEDYEVKPDRKIQGKLLAVYNPKGEKTHSPNESFEWSTSKETGYAVLLPPDVITKYELTAFHFLELSIEYVVKLKGPVAVYPDETKQRKWWPDAKMKLKFTLPYAAP